MQLEKMCKRLIIREPFYGLIMLGLNKRHTTKIQTLAVAKAGIGVELWINDDFWNSLNEKAQQAILLHELHHICFNHMMMGKDFPETERFNIAADAEVNGYLTNLPPDDGHVDCRKWGLPEKQGTKFYYENMPEDLQQKLRGNPNKPPHGSEGNDSDGNGQAGNQPQDNQQKSQQGNSQSNGGTPHTMDDHSTWKEFDKCNEAQKELLKNQIEAVIKDAAEQTIKQRGTIPEQFKSLIDELLKVRPRIYDWKSDFRRMLGTEIELKLRKTHQRESRRFPSMPGIRFRKKISILIAIDTSGSVSNTELSEFFSEIDHIMKAGAKVSILECDAAVTAEPWEYKGLHNIQITGRGGTWFKPAVDYYREHHGEYTKFVYFTDGEGPIDDLEVPNNDMTWVITSDGCRQDYPGKVIYIPKNNEQ